MDTLEDDFSEYRLSKCFMKNRFAIDVADQFHLMLVEQHQELPVEAGVKYNKVFKQLGEVQTKKY